MQLSPNQKIFCHFFLTFQNLHKSLEYFEKEDDPQRLLVSEIIDCKKPGYLNA